MGLFDFVFGKKQAAAGPAPAGPAPAPAPPAEPERKVCTECGRALLAGTSQCPFCKPQHFVGDLAEGTVAVDSASQKNIVAMGGVATASQMARQNGARAFLHIFDGTNKGMSVLLGSRPLTIGRATDNTLALNDTGASSKHAEIRQVGSTWVIADVGSKNGVFVNEQKVKEKVLVNGDVVGIGTSRMYVGVLSSLNNMPAAAAGPAPAPAPTPAPE